MTDAQVLIKGRMDRKDRGGRGGRELGNGDGETGMGRGPMGRGDCEGAMGRGRWGGRQREGGDGEVGYGKREVGREEKWRGVEGTRGGRISQIDMEYLGEADRMPGQQRLWHSLIATSTWNACVE